MLLSITDAYSAKMTAGIEHILGQITELDSMLEDINQKISKISEEIKTQFSLSRSGMSVNQNYLLSGIQRSPNPKNYIVTSKGIEVVGEQEITPVSVFLDAVIQFANDPNRKIIVLKELVKHLQKMNETASNNSMTS
ncbi:MAG TPA: hypothetical protein VE544_04945 [Nitrososphaeraceae archaeon]|nr:hypothetical protein [Nitrososphaeraceae archaeon]